MSVAALIAVRNRALDDFVDGRTNEATHRADMDAIAVELDRVISPRGERPVQERAARVVAEILAASRARRTELPPARAARLEFWRRHRLERLRRDDPAAYEADLREEAELQAAEPDEVRLARPVLAALGDESIARVAQERVQAIAARPLPETSPPPAAALPDVDWTEDDRLSWEEFIAGVPCQGCGRAFLGDETSQGDREPWTAYRARMEPIESEFASRHPGHGTRWTVGGGPLHCRRCCAPHPLSPEQIRRLSQILNPPSAPATQVPVRRCKTCRQPLESGHVCRLDDLPADLRKVVDEAVAREVARQRSKNA